MAKSITLEALNVLNMASPFVSRLGSARDVDCGVACKQGLFRMGMLISGVPNPLNDLVLSWLCCTYVEVQ